MSYKKIKNTHLHEKAGSTMSLQDFEKHYGHLFDDVKKAYKDFGGKIDRKKKANVDSDNAEV